VSDGEFFHKSNITNGDIVSRYLSVLRRLHAFISSEKIAQCVIVDYELLKIAIFQYFVDIAQLKDFQQIEKASEEKIYAYMAYWLLKRKPIQVTRPFPKSKFINELFVTTFIVTSILAEKNLKSVQWDKTEFSKFQLLLFYHLKYRVITPQTLELMIEAFFCGCSFVATDSSE
jgi:hypothetical protein